MKDSLLENADKTLDGDFWKDTHRKQSPDLRSGLVNWIKQHGTAKEFSLHHIDLSNIDLVRQGSPVGYRFINCDLYKADLQGSHLFNTDFSGSSLMKADLTGADLHCAKMESCNLLGAKFTDANIENINWGTEILQERQAREAQRKGDKTRMMMLVQQAEEIYRHLHLETEKQGLYENAGFFFRKEMTMRRLRMPRYSLPRLISKIVDIICGYGEKPSNLIKFSVSVILFCACSYFLLGINQNGLSIAFNNHNILEQNIENFFSCLYFSVVTFTTLGYGDLTPIGPTRVMAALEAFTGSFTIALFVVVFVKKMTR